MLRSFLGEPMWLGRARAFGFLAVALLALGLLLLAASPARAADFTVNSMGDPGTGGCNTSECTLREAIDAANNAPGADNIKFGIPEGTGTKTISPTSALPQVTDPLTIDGTTQPGYAGTPVIELSGANAGPSTSGLRITAGSSTIKGLIVNDFDLSAISLSGGWGNAVEGCYLGTDASGTQDRGNGGGVGIYDSASNRIGGADPGQGNLISGNGYGVNVEGDLGQNVIQGNLIGTNAAGDAKLGNDYSGVRLSIGVQGTGVGGNVISGNGTGVEFYGSTGKPVRNNVISGNYIGTDKTGTKNLGNWGYGVRADGAIFNDVIGNAIAFNGFSGVALLGADDKVFVRQNSIYSNGPDGLGIDLGGDGVTPNDPGDADTGPNGLQNYPVLTTAENIGGTTVIKGTLSSTPNTSFRIEFFSSAKADPSGHGEGRVWLLPPSADVMTDGTGKATIEYKTENEIPIGHVVSATATPDEQVSGSFTTSEFSNAITVSGPPQTTITSGPSGTVKSDSASFGFTSSEPASTFQCRLDEATFSSCSSPKSYTGLSNGTHTFRVRAIDPASNVDPTPAVRTWTVDTIKPTVSAVSPRHTSITRDTAPTIRATVKDNTRLAKANIKLYVAGRLISATKYTYAPGTGALVHNSPKLSSGKKTVKIVVTDAARNVGTKSWYFTIR